MRFGQLGQNLVVSKDDPLYDLRVNRSDLARGDCFPWTVPASKLLADGTAGSIPRSFSPMSTDAW